MIDGIHCVVHDDSLKNIVHCPKLEFVNYPNRAEAKYKGLIVTIYKESASYHLRGSIHKFKNDGLHNADLFTYQDFVSALKKLELELEIYSKDLYVIKFEIGVNVPLGYPVYECINTVAFINNKMPIKTTYNMLVTYQQYSIKVYSKSRQYTMFKTDNILRIEIAYDRKVKLTKDICKIEKLDELLNPFIWKKMADVLRGLVTKFVFFDYSEIKKEELTLEEFSIFNEWTNPIRASQEYNKTRKFRYKRLASEIYLKYSKNTKAKHLIKLVDERLDEMLQFEATDETN